MQALPISGVARLVAPIITNNVGRGYLSIIGREGDLDEIDQLVCEHGAAACALEMAKQKAVNETEKRLRGTFLDRLLLGDVSQQEAIRQGERFNHDMTQTHVAFCSVLARRQSTVTAAIGDNGQRHHCGSAGVSFGLDSREGRRSRPLSRHQL